MIAHAKKLFAPPVFPGDDDRTRAARVLNILVWSFMLVMALAAIVGSFVFAAKRLSLLFILTFLASAMVAHLLLRLRRVHLASLFFVSCVWITLTVFLTLAGGMSTAAASFYLVCAVFCGLLLGTRAAVILSVLSVLAGLGMVLLNQDADLIPRLFPVPEAAALVDVSIGLCLVIITLGVTLNSIQDALSAARRELAERRKAEQVLERRSAELEALREAAQVMGSSLNVDEILRLILDQLKRVLVYDTASVIIFREGHVPDLIVGLGYADERMTSRSAGKLLQNSPILGRMAQDLQPVISPDVRGLEGWIWVPGAEHVRSWLCIPLVAREQMIGALMADHSRTGFFGPDELRSAHSLAQHATQAIENARLYDETLRRNRELAVLNRVIAVSAASPDIEILLETACEELARVFDRAHAVAVLFDREKKEALVVAEHRSNGHARLLGRMMALDPVLPGWNRQEPAPPPPGNDSGIDSRLAQIRELFGSGETAHLLILPLVDEEELLGSLAVALTGTRPFAREEVSLAQRVADQVSGALARAWLEDERRGLEDHFRQTQKMEALGRLAGGIAHDFNNLIAVIQLSSQMMERQLHPQDPLRQHVAQIRDTGERATRLVKQLLSFSRRDTVEPRVLHLQDVVLDLSPMLRRILGEAIDLSLSLPADLWPVQADPSQMEQVLVNLVVNARDAMPNGGTLTIDLANVVIDQAYVSAHLDARRGDHVRVTVTDTGVGMSEDVLPHIFEPFFTTKPEGKGTGLGLSTVFGIVTRSGGHIQVQSQPGQGTTLRIYLPRAEAK